MRRYLFLILIALNAMVSYAYDFEVDGIEYNLLSIENNTVEVANTSNVANPNDGTARVLVIPASININGHELTVAAIGDYAVQGPSPNYDGWYDRAWYCGLFSEIYLPETIETIGNWAFYDQKTIEIIELPQSLKHIGDYAFSRCKKLRNIIFKDGLKHIGESAFSECPVEEIDLPESVEFLGRYALSSTSIRTFKLPSSLKEIGFYPFSDCRNLEYIDLEPLRSFGELPAGLLGKSGVRRVIIPDWVSIIPEQFFQECKNIEELELGTALEHIEDYAFRYCRFHNPIVLPEGLKTIGASAFSMAEMKGTLIVPSSVEQVENHALSFKKLDSLIFQPSDAMLYTSSDKYEYGVTIIDSYSELKYLYLDRGIYKNIQGEIIDVEYSAKVVELGEMFMRSQPEKRRNKFRGVYKFVIQEGVENLDYEFKCDDTNSIMLPSTLKTIKASIFKETKNLTNIDCRAQEPPQCEGIVFADLAYIKAKLTVPLGCKEAYQNADGWKYFWNIEETKEAAYEGSQNDIKAVMQDDADWFSISDGGIKAAEALKIYSLDGRMVKSVERGEAVDSLHGMYIIKCGSKTAKVML